MKTIWVSRYYNGTADVFDEDHGPPSWPYVDTFEAKQRIAELEAQVTSAYKQGYDDGYSKGFTDGYTEKEQELT